MGHLGYVAASADSSMNTHQVKISGELLTQSPQLNLAACHTRERTFDLWWMVSKMHAVFLPFVLFMCLCTSGKTQEKKCEKSTLKRPKNVDLSSLDTSYSLGQSVRLRCEPGYTGLYRASCKENGWELAGRACQKRSCGHPGDTPNGDFELIHEDDFVFGAVVQYTCKTGYRMMSRNTQRNCVASGWDNDVPVCEVVKCPVIQVADNIQASGNVEDGSYGDVIQFQCPSPDMQLSGLEEIHCTNEGKWSGEFPTCREIKCEKPDIPHGKVTGTESVFRKDDIVRYTCDEGYKVSHGPNPKCTKTGWTSTPECKEITCNLDKASPETTRHPAHQNIFLPGKKVEIDCQEGYRTSTYKQRDTFLCGKDGYWLPSKLPDCEEIHCTQPQEWNARLPNYWYKRPYKFKDTAQYSCVGDYKPVKKSATCELEGWTPKPLCVHKDVCLSPTIENGYIVKPDEKKVVFACNRGFKLNTGGWWKESLCIKGSWSVTPHCIDQNKCISRPVSEYVKYTEPVWDNYWNGYGLRFQCEEGYTSESKFIYCKNGEWDKPECKRDVNSCTVPPNVENAIIISQYQKFYSNMFKVTYECHKSYRLVPHGEGEITCNSGVWTNHPTCVSVCDAPTGDDTVTYKYNGWMVYLDKDFLEFACKPGYKSELQHIQCQNQTWGKPNCTRDSEMCTTPPTIKNGQTITLNKEQYPKESKVKYKCNWSFKMDGNDTITCSSGNWTDPPTCTRNCDKPDGEHMKLEPDQKKYDEGTTVKYICQEPFTAEPNRELICVNGRWNGQVACALPPYSCLPPPLAANSLIKVVNVKQVYFHGYDVLLQCPPSHSFQNGARELEFKCLGGQWSYDTINLKCFRRVPVQ